jgi:hypothetical protein
MALATRWYKFRGHCDARLYNTCSSIQTYGFPTIVNGPDDIKVSYDDAVDNSNDLDTAMSVEGWEPLSPQP